MLYETCKIFNALKHTWKLVEQGQLSFLLKHQGTENYFPESVPCLDQFSLCEFPESFYLSEELNLHTDCGPQHGRSDSVVFYSFRDLSISIKTIYNIVPWIQWQLHYLKSTLLNAVRREKLAAMEVWRLEAEIEAMKHLVWITMTSLMHLVLLESAP